MRRIYKLSLSVIGIMLIFLLIVAASYINYIKEVNSEGSIVLVEDGLSINYLNGNKINTNGLKKTYTISVTNNSNDTLHYYIEVNNIDSNKKNIKYNLIEKNNKINLTGNEFPTSKSELASFIEIETGATHTYDLTILANEDSYLRANIKVEIEVIEEANFATTILINNDIKKAATTKIGEEAATTNEGLIELAEENGNSYYFRGAITNNYVSFANLTWRIVKINSDGSVKLILNNYIDDKANYYNADNAGSIDSKMKFTDSNINNALKTWYQTNLNGYEKYIANSKYCVDDSVGEIDETNNTYYLGYYRLLTDYSQVNTCLGSKYNAKIGLLTADEAVYAGASKNSDNASYYLYTAEKDHSWWTMTPASSNGTEITYFDISSTGKLTNLSAGSYYRGIKPVINLAKKTYVNGTGTESDPYTIK